MCSPDKIASCQIAFAPIESKKGYQEDIKKVLAIIEGSQLTTDIGMFSTNVLGPKDKIFELIETIYDQMTNDCGFILDIKISNICGCKL